MAERSTAQKLAGAVGGVVVLGTLGCLTATAALAGLAVVGGGAGYLIGEELLALAFVKTAIVGGVALRRYR